MQICKPPLQIVLHSNRPWKKKERKNSHVHVWNNHRRLKTLFIEKSNPPHFALHKFTSICSVILLHQDQDQSASTNVIVNKFFNFPRPMQCIWKIRKKISLSSHYSRTPFGHNKRAIHLKEEKKEERRCTISHLPFIAY